MVRPDGCSRPPLVLRFAPDRRRSSGDVLPGAAPGSGVAVGKHVAKRDDQQTLRHPSEEIEIQLAHLTQRIPGHLELSLDRGLAQVIG